MVTRIWWWALTGAVLWAAEDPQQTARAAMEPSLAKQRSSIQKQLKESQGAQTGWWTVAWPREENWIPSIEAAREEEAAPQKTSFAIPCPPLPSSVLNPAIDRAAEGEGLSANLLRAVVHRESGGYPCAVSHKGAMGLMQLMPSTAARFGVTDPMDPVSNLSAGAKFLGQMMDRYGGDVKKALAAFNAGPGKVDAYGGVPPYEETRSYVRRILESLGAQ